MYIMSAFGQCIFSYTLRQLQLRPLLLTSPLPLPPWLPPPQRYIEDEFCKKFDWGFAPLWYLSRWQPFKNGLTPFFSPPVWYWSRRTGKVVPYWSYNPSKISNQKSTGTICVHSSTRFLSPRRCMIPKYWFFSLRNFTVEDFKMTKK